MPICEDIEKKINSTNDSQTTEALAQDLLENPKKKKDSCSFYEYAKGHPGFFATLVSAFVAVVAFILNSALYWKIEMYLHYWGFNNINVDITLGNQIYVLSVALLFLVVTTCLAFFLSETFSVYQKHSNVYSYLKLANNQLSRELRLAKISTWWRSIQITFVELKYGKHTRTAELRDELVDAKKRLDHMTKQCKHSKQMIASMRKTNAQELLPSLLISNLILFVIMWMFVSTKETYQPWQRFLIMVLITILIDALIYSFVRVESTLFNPEHRRTKRILKQDPNKACDIIVKIAERNLTKYPIETMVKNKSSKLFTNKSIVFALVLVICSLLSLLALFFDGIEESTSELNKFATTQLDGEIYAIIYNNGPTYYLNKASIDNDIITIDTLKQRITVSNDMFYDIREYANTIRLPEAEEVVATSPTE